jgi:hypothetical protein
MSELIDNRAARIRTLKEVIQDLHRGKSPDSVRDRLRALVTECQAGEIAAMEQELMADGVPVEQIMGMCDLHSQVVHDLLVETPRPALPQGHPAEVFRRENEALRAAAARLREDLGRLTDDADGGTASPEILGRCRSHLSALMGVEKHYARKENLLFPYLEKRGITGPSKVMWGKDDEVRALLKTTGEALGASGGTVGEWKLVAEAVVRPALDAIEEMVRKEEKILIPMSLETLTETEWGEIWSQSPEFGWCLVDPAGEYAPPSAAGPEVPSEVSLEAERSGAALHLLRIAGTEPPRSARGSIVFPSGSLSLPQLRALFDTLPVDLTFVDADDRVRFFSEGPRRVFVRSNAIIGRKVQHCHPPSSVHVVEQILSDFRSGRQDVAEFWIHFQGRFVHIRYFALRGDGGAYLGTLEVTQDLTRERALEGERRLLEYA